MFTGIIEEVGNLISLGGHSGVIRIQASHVLENTKIGDSIAVNGICLTVTNLSENKFTADVMPETIRHTSLSELSRGAKVNLERAVLPITRMGGHFVTGHIDDVGEITNIRKEKNAIWLSIRASENILSGIVQKGSIALDGISLTVAEVEGNTFAVSLIPHTRSVTNLSEKKIGSLINIETDILGKYVEQLLRGNNESRENSQSLGISRSFLAENGF